MTARPVPAESPPFSVVLPLLLMAPAGLIAAGLLLLSADGDTLANALHGVVDPELGIDIIELGLVYQISDADNALAVTMTTTSDQCPMGEVMLAATRACLLHGWPPGSVPLAVRGGWSEVLNVWADEQECRRRVSYGVLSMFHARQRQAGRGATGS